MRTILLYPKFPDTFWSFKHALKFIRKKASLPPLGLLTIASMLPPDWQKRLVDVNVQKLTDADLEWADVVLVSAMVAQRTSTHELIARCKAAGKTVIAGGPLFGMELADFPQVDHFILREAETTLPEFLKDFKQDRAQRVYSATAFPDIRKTPAPMWELANLKRYATMSIQFSRGCPFDCDFCNITELFGRQPRTKTGAQIVAELDSLYQVGWRGSVFFVDDNLIGNKQQLKQDLLPALIAWNKGRQKISFNTEASINLADDAELMRLMVEAGFNTVFIGIETPDEACLAECCKKQNRGRDLLANVKSIQNAGMQVQAGFIVGFDSDTPSIFQRQVEFIQKSGIVTAMVGLLQAIPDTRLYKRLQQEGRILRNPTGDNVDGTTNFIPRMNLDVLSDGYKSILRRIYAPRPYYKRIRIFLREYRPPRIKTTFKWGNLKTLLYSSVRLGIVGRERVQYWNLIIWTLFRRPALLKTAVTLAIYGHHFRKVCAAIDV
ncbi:B12-binding domain-containing radical SAM protein [Pontiella sulfatireligans]|uniref:Hopanoid C-2 methylase n=1 Tax=Pontiella sulfatireligans TaxID=2750658 RepID=A0A6C2URD0_9BACT|nr:B12-binding domain-containing radical SAM protein [Pontiella sulfatireligans]VGO22882.1 Hopanoid C-2 methylase [Pontiella sulfatireligans]